MAAFSTSGKDGSSDGFEHLRRDHHRRRPQRPHERRVLRARTAPARWCWRSRDKTGGAADTSAPFADHPEINVTTYSYVMSLMPPTIIRELKLKQFGYDVTPFGPYFQAFPDGRAITVYADDAKKSYDSIAQFSKKDADTLPKWEAWMKGVSDVLGPLLLQRAAARGVDEASATCCRSCRPRGRCASSASAASADVTRLFTMSVTDLLERLVRVRRDQGDAHGQRRDRHVGRSRRARHRLRDAAPLDRRRRRRPPRLVGVPAGRHGRGERLDPPRGRVVRRRGPHRAPRCRRSSSAAAARSAWRSRTARSFARRSSSADDPPEDRVPRPARPARAARRLRLGHRALEDALAAP